LIPTFSSNNFLFVFRRGDCFHFLILLISKDVIFINKLNDIEELRSRMIQILKKEDYNFLNNSIQEISRKLDNLIVKEMFDNRKN